MKKPSANKMKTGKLEDVFRHHFADAENAPAPDVWSRLDQQLSQQETTRYRHRLTWYRRWMLACLLLVAGVVLYSWHEHQSLQTPSAIEAGGATATGEGAATAGGEGAGKKPGQPEQQQLAAADTTGRGAGAADRQPVSGEVSEKQPKNGLVASQQNRIAASSPEGGSLAQQASKPALDPQPKPGQTHRRVAGRHTVTAGSAGKTGAGNAEPKQQPAVPKAQTAKATAPLAGTDAPAAAQPASEQPANAAAQVKEKATAPAAAETKTALAPVKPAATEVKPAAATKATSTAEDAAVSAPAGAATTSADQSGSAIAGAVTEKEAAGRAGVAAAESAEAEGKLRPLAVQVALPDTAVVIELVYLDVLPATDAAEEDYANRLHGLATRWSITGIYGGYAFMQELSLKQQDVLPPSVLAAAKELSMQLQEVYSYQAGLQVGYRFSRKWRLETGLLYTENNAQATTSYVLQNYFNATDGNRPYALPERSSVFLPLVSEFSDLNQAVVTQQQAFTTSYRYRYYGVPVQLHFKSRDYGLYFFFTAGATANRLFRASIWSESNAISSSRYDFNEESPFRKWLWSANGAMGLGLHLGNSSSIFAGPDAAYYLSPYYEKGAEGKFLSTSTYSVGVRAGLTYTFNKARK